MFEPIQLFATTGKNGAGCPPATRVTTYVPYNPRQRRLQLDGSLQYEAILLGLLKCAARAQVYRFEHVVNRNASGPYLETFFCKVSLNNKTRF